MNKTLFPSAGPPPANTRNAAGGLAYKMSAEHALAQFAATGCLNDTYYTKAEDQLAEVLKLAAACDPEFVAKVAIYARDKGAMKDMPALLTAHLVTRQDGQSFAKLIFPAVINNGKMLRNFVQALRSGALGRKSLGTVAKRLVQRWFETRDGMALFRNSIGDKPSLADVIRLAHPRPDGPEKAAVHAYLLGKERLDGADYLPRPIQDYERFKVQGGELPRVPFEMLQGLNLTPENWKQLATQMTWTQLRKNLNTLARHGALKDNAVARQVVAKLSDRDEVKRAHPMPYELLVAYMSTQASMGVPENVRNALQDAMEHAVDNVPEIPGGVVVCPDISGSMNAPVTGYRGSATSVVSCRMAAALISSVIMRRNQESGVLPFSDHVVPTRLNPRDSIMTNAQVLARLPSGGTDCSAPIRYLNQTGVRAKTIILVSDNESWVDLRGVYAYSRFGYGSTKGDRSTATKEEWNKYARRVPGSKLVCLDLAPNSSVQATDSANTMNIGGFSDAVFDVIARFVNGETGATADHWVKLIKETQLPQ